MQDKTGVDPSSASDQLLLVFYPKCLKEEWYLPYWVMEIDEIAYMKHLAQ